ncbi:MAG: hypothetical protein H6605_10245 [Flavobacteriales bacterium]|nr:hypothetical protein [Flavobacteriales bacterium]
MQQTSIDLSVFRLYEPMTFITDIVLSAYCIYLLFKIRKYRAKIWPVFFLSMAFATFLGAFGHGLYEYKNNVLQHTSRMFGVLSVYCGMLASAIYLVNKRLRSAIMLLASIQFLTAFTMLLQKNDFRLVSVNATLGFGVVVAGIHIYLLLNKGTGSGFVLLGVAINAIAGLIHRFQISPGKWFNHNDLGHVFMLFGLYFISRGIIHLQEQTQTFKSK